MNRIPKKTSSYRRIQGFSLIEVVVSTLIVGLLMVPAVTLLTSVARSYYRSAERDRAFALAETLMSEIVQSYFADPDLNVRRFGPEPNEQTTNRADFDDVDDYAGLFEHPPLKKDGTAIPGMGDFTQTVVVRPVTVPANTLQVQAGATDLNTIKVKVTGPSGIEVEVSALRHEKSSMDEPPFVQSTIVRKIELQMGMRKPGQQILTGTDILNQVQDN